MLARGIGKREYVRHPGCAPSLKHTPVCQGKTACRLALAALNKQSSILASTDANVGGMCRVPGRPGGAEREKLLAGYWCQREGVWACAGCLDGLAALNELRLNDCRVAALPAGLAAAQRLRILDLGHNPVRRAKDLQVSCEHAPHHASSNFGFHKSVSWVFWVSVFVSFGASMCRIMPQSVCATLYHGGAERHASQ